MMYLALEFSEERERHSPGTFLKYRECFPTPKGDPDTHLPAASSAMTRYVNPPSEM